jgi:hypothetical protein
MSNEKLPALLAAATFSVVVLNALALLALLLLAEAVGEAQAEGPLVGVESRALVETRRANRGAVGPALVEGAGDVERNVGLFIPKGFFAAEGIIEVGRAVPLNVDAAQRAVAKGLNGVLFG